MPRRRKLRRNARAVAGALVLGLVILRCGLARVDHPAARPKVTPRGEPSGSRIGQSPHLALGLPKDSNPSDDLLLDEREYVVSYNERRRSPNWVAWKLERADLGHAHRRDDFREDPSLPAGVYRVTPEDYARSGYERGHLCPSGDRTASRDVNSITFLMTNIVPQRHALNAGPWEKLEQHARARAAKPGAVVYALAGPLYDRAPSEIGHGVAVPRATWKILVVLEGASTARDVTTNTDIVSVLMPNEDGIGARDWSEFSSSVDAIEAETGYDFLSSIPDHVEAVVERR